MKLPLVVVALCAVFIANPANAAEKIQLKTEKDKLSYTKGVNLGNSFKRQSVDVDQKIFLQGVQDSVSGAEPLLTIKEMVAIEEKFQREGAAKKVEEQRKLAEKNKKEGEAFLAENAKKEGVKVLPSGLQYKVITEGKGKKPATTDKVLVNYKGTMVDGTVFDDSDKHPEHPMLMPVSHKELIAGWTEAILLMNEGSKWQIFIPSGLGFKERGLPPLIGPNSALIFDVELISIAKADEAGKTGKTEKTEEKKKN